MKWATSFISVSSRTKTCRFFVTICGARPTAAKLGWSAHLTEAQAAATRSGSPSIRPPAQDTASNTRQTTALTVAAAACNFNVPPTAGSPGRRRLVFLTRLYTERSTWTLMVTFLSAAKETWGSFASVRAMRRSGARHRLLTEAPPSTWVASSVAGELIQQHRRWIDLQRTAQDQ